jgi:hypothetical protein
MGKLLGRLSSPTLKADELLEGSGSSEQLNQYISDFAAEQLEWRDLRHATWFSAPRNDEGTGSPSDYAEVLYVMRTLRDRTQFLGVTYDGSAESTSASASSLALSRLIGRRV